MSFHLQMTKYSFFAVLAGLFLFGATQAAAQNAMVISSPRCNEFTFDATNSSAPEGKNLTYRWDLGDGTVETEPIVDHIYEKSGDYNITLTISDNAGLECSTAVTKQKIRVNIPPYASFSSPENACVNQELKFDAASSVDENRGFLRLNWDFGDGVTVADKSKVTKSYSKGGNYSVKLTVDDGGEVCNVNTKEKTIRVNEPPKADAGENEILKCVSTDEDLVVPFDASNTTDTNNDVLTYNWDFGDGDKGSGIQATHRYKQLGTYDAKLIVKDDSNMSCSTAVDFVRVRLNEAPKAEAGEDIVTCSGENIEFDGSQSYIHKKGTLAAKWFFGDGNSAEGLKVTYSYPKPGKYQASLSVENSLNNMCPPSRDTKEVVINSPPAADLKVKDSACAGKEVNFDASGSTDADGDNLEFYWTFGDGTILRSGSKVSHIYEQGGIYRVSLIVDDGKKSSCSTDVAKAEVKINTPPMADAGPNTTCCASREAVFDASGSSDPDADNLTYTWDFGDGMQEKGMKVTHAYANSGSYNVTLTVDDNTNSSCSRSTAGFTATVNNAPVPVIMVR